MGSVVQRGKDTFLLREHSAAGIRGSVPPGSRRRVRASRAPHKLASNFAGAVQGETCRPDGTLPVVSVLGRSEAGGAITPKKGLGLAERSGAVGGHRMPDQKRTALSSSVRRARARAF